MNIVINRLINHQSTKRQLEKSPHFKYSIQIQYIYVAADCVCYSYEVIIIAIGECFQLSLISILFIMIITQQTKLRYGHAEMI